MTNAELLAKIKAEIDKLYAEYKDKFHQYGDQYHLGLIDGLDMAERVLDTIESEKPMDPGERIGSYNIVPYIDDKIAKLQDMWREEKLSFDWDDLKDMIEDVARHFAEWGAEHLADDRKTSSNDLEEAAEKSLRLAGFHNMETRGMDWKGGFIAGAKWDRKQMMKEFPKWRKIKAGERLPCPAYVWTIVYDNYPGCFEGRLMPNIEGVRVGRDTWYLPVDVIHNLPKED